jgi:hypothetical protein
MNRRRRRRPRRPPEGGLIKEEGTVDTPDREPEPLRNTVPPRDSMPPREAGPIRSYAWEWGREEDRGLRLPWIGVFLVVYGALLLVSRMIPDALVPANLLVLAAGLTFLILWLLRRGTFSLYAGAFLTASAIPGLVRALGYDVGPGLGTLCYGLAFLFVAAVRLQRGGGIGWQAILGGALALLGASQLALPSSAELLLPFVLVILGLVLLTRQRT